MRNIILGNLEKLIDLTQTDQTRDICTEPNTGETSIPSPMCKILVEDLTPLRNQTQ